MNPKSFQKLAVLLAALVAWPLFRSLVIPVPTSLQWHEHLQQPSSSLLHPYILIVVPGLGQNERLPLLASSVQSLQRSAESGDIGFACVVYVWKTELIELATRSLDVCQVVYSDGLWTHHMLHMKNHTSWKNRATHVAILMDDVDVRSVHVPRMLHTMQRLPLDIAAPSTYGAFRSGDPRPHCRAHVTGHVDMLFTVFTNAAYTCWLDMLDISINPHGWGYDLSVADTCRARVGVTNDAYLVHAAPATDDERQYNANTAYMEMMTWMALARNGSFAAAHDYQAYTKLVRPVEWGYCHDVHFRLDSNERKRQALWSNESTTQWDRRARLVSTLLTDQPDVFMDAAPSVHTGGPWHNQTTTIEFRPDVDGWASAKDHVPWVGLVLDATLAVSSPALTALAVSHSLALVGVTSHMVHWLTQQLQDTAAHHVTVCRVSHFVVPARHGFDPNRDGVVQAVQAQAVVLWGDDARVASLRQLRTRRTKIWLVSSGTRAMAHNRTTVPPLDTNGIAIDASVQIMNVAQLSEDGNERILLRNIVLVDPSAKGSYAAAIDALEYQAPFFMRQLDGFVEYLGAEYPLFFTSLDQVQSILDDEALLQRKLLEAHRYLQSRDTSHLTVESFTNAIVNCTLKAMANWTF